MYVWVSDFARFYVVVTALWLIAVLIRLTQLRIREIGWRRLFKRQESPHPFSTMGLAVLMLVGIFRRFEDLGQPGDRFLWLVSVGITAVLTGVLININFTLTPPWKRR